jgi:hypothetical protein
MPPVVARCEASLGKLYRRASVEAMAESHLSTAARMFRAMQMHFWVGQLASEGVS